MNGVDARAAVREIDEIVVRAERVERGTGVGLGERCARVVCGRDAPLRSV